jgi:hypothetical protein
MLQSERFRELAACKAMTEADKELIERVYEEVFRHPLSLDFVATCPNKYNDAAAAIASYYRRHEGGCDYVLKRGVVFKYKGRIITTQNLTNESAEWFISQDERNKDKFIVIG